MAETRTAQAKARASAQTLLEAGDTLAANQALGLVRTIEGFSLLHQGDREAALSALLEGQRAATGWDAFNPINGFVRWRIADLLVDLGREEDAIPYLRSLSEPYYDPYGSLELGKVYEAVGRPRRGEGAVRDRARTLAEGRPHARAKGRRGPAGSGGPRLPTSGLIFSAYSCDRSVLRRRGLHELPARDDRVELRRRLVHVHDVVSVRVEGLGDRRHRVALAAIPDLDRGIRVRGSDDRRLGVTALSTVDVPRIRRARLAAVQIDVDGSPLRAAADDRLGVGSATARGIRRRAPALVLFRHLDPRLAGGVRGGLGLTDVGVVSTSS